MRELGLQEAVEAAAQGITEQLAAGLGWLPDRPESERTGRRCDGISCSPGGAAAGGCGCDELPGDIGGR